MAHQLDQSRTRAAFSQGEPWEWSQAAWRTAFPSGIVERVEPGLNGLGTGDVHMPLNQTCGFGPNAYGLLWTGKTHWSLQGSCQNGTVGYSAPASTDDETNLPGTGYQQVAHMRISPYTAYQPVNGGEPLRVSNPPSGTDNCTSTGLDGGWPDCKLVRLAAHEEGHNNFLGDCFLKDGCTYDNPNISIHHGGPDQLSSEMGPQRYWGDVIQSNDGITYITDPAALALGLPIYTATQIPRGPTYCDQHYYQRWYTAFPNFP
jgi:hypothetical protein